MVDSDSDDDKVVQEVIPPHVVRFNDMPQALFKKVIKCKKMQILGFFQDNMIIIKLEADVLIKEAPEALEKDLALSLVKYVKSLPEFKIGDGEWQCVIGKNFGCSLTFDATVLTFFDLLPSRKSILLFKSG